VSGPILWLGPELQVIRTSARETNPDPWLWFLIRENSNNNNNNNNNNDNDNDNDNDDNNKKMETLFNNFVIYYIYIYIQL
jgi:hypothetical protein